MSEGAADHEAFCRALSIEERMLVDLRDELFGGDWTLLIKELTDRKDGQPHIVELTARIEQDLQRIERLRAYEARCNVDLAEVFAGLPARDGNRTEKKTDP